MKKTFLLVLSAFMFYSMTSCNAPPKAEAFSEEKFLADIAPNIACFDSCILEMFCAETDMNDSYLAAYESESAYANGTGNIALLFKPEEEKKYAEKYFIDPTYSSYYTVTNFKTNSEVRDHLKKYLSDNIIDTVFSNDFLEYEGQLYLRRGSRGYGALTCDLESVKYIGEKDGKQYVTMDFKLFDEFDHTETLEFTRINDIWIMTDKTVSEQTK